MVGKRVLVVPELSDAATLKSVVARLAHYFSTLALERILIPLDSAIDIDSAKAIVVEPTLPAGFDNEIRSRIEQIARIIEFRCGTASLDMEDTTCDVVIVWDATATERAPWDQLVGKYRLNRTRFVIDWQSTRSDGIAFADAARVLSPGWRTYDPAESERFGVRTSHLRSATRAYLIATGPSARFAMDEDLSDGVRIACNTVILDDELMGHVKPDVVTFADPIFHFGPSTYAHEFQRALDRQAAVHDFTVVTLERFAGLLRRRMPHLAGRIVGVRLGRPEWIQNLDLFHELIVRPYPNILTMLMLPLAATFARDISMFGFDGRGADETYYWRHGETVQFARELEEIQLVHPGFFQISYADYYDEHVQALERLIVRIERRGGSISAGSPSFMTPMRRRFARPGLDPLPGCESKRTPPESDVIISVTPDWADQWGHFGPWEHAVGNAARTLDYEYRSLASRALVPQDQTELQSFTHGTTSDEPFDASLFERELRGELAQIVGPAHRSYVSFYTGDVWHLPSLLAIARDHPDTLFAVNLMRAHASIADARNHETAWSTAIAQLLTACVESANGTNLVICLDTDSIAIDLELVSGVRLPTWPMILVANPDLLSESSTAPHGPPVRLVAPIQTQEAKGFADMVPFAELASGRLSRREWSLAVRFVSQPAGAAARDVRAAERLVELGVELIEGPLSDEQYARMIGEAHVVVLPYHCNPFRTRTSAVLLDAIAAGKPVVAARGTWAGDLIERHAFGATYLDGDVGALHEAVGRVVEDLDNLTHRVVAGRQQILDDFRPERLVRFLIDVGALRRDRPPTDEAVVMARRTAQTILAVHRNGEAHRVDREITHQVHVDNLTRSRDDALDRTEQLKRAVRSTERARIDAEEALKRMTAKDLSPVPPQAARPPVPQRSPVVRRVRRVGARVLRAVGVDPARLKAVLRRVRRRVRGR